VFLALTRFKTENKMKSPSAMPLIISIEGNIGTGKSTIVENLKKYMKDIPGVVFLKEPVDIWESIKDSNTGETILQKFYADPQKYAFSFQVMAYASRLSVIRQQIHAIPAPDIIICERSLEADYNIFAKMLHDDGMIDDVNYKIYKHFYEEFSYKYGLDAVVYIDSDAEICHERIKKRAREGESGIPLDYLQKCKSYHDTWLGNVEMEKLHLNTNSDATYDGSDIGSEWLEQIKQFILTTHSMRENNYVD
jgi:deoxyadenosine/deoxycytidine kinase